VTPDPYATGSPRNAAIPASDQPTAPYLDALIAYGFRGSTRFHVPGHKGGAGADPGLRSALGSSALLLDLPQDLEGIDLGPSPTPYERAEQLAAEAYGAERTWFLTNGASQGNHALCLALAPLGTHAVVQRNSHASVIDGMVLSGGVPHYVAPTYDDGLGMAHGVTPEALGEELSDAAAEGTPARAAFIVSPTYYGLAADVAGCAEVAHAAGAVLVVDQSWGPHLGFHRDLPPSALALGADGASTGTPGSSAGPTVFGPTLGALVSLPVAVIGAVAAGRLRIPAGGLIGPLVLAAALTAAGAGAVPPGWLLNAAFAVIGLMVGLRFDRETGRRVGRLAPAMLAAVVGVILGCAGLGLVLVAALDVSFLTAYLATTPGGLSAVLAVAFAGGADTTIVLAVQALRLLLMVLAAPVAARLLRPR